VTAQPPLSARTWLIVAFTAACIVAAFVVPAMPQSLDYHDFADQRGKLGIDHFMNVVSNLGFFIAGVAGLGVVLAGRARFAQQRERWNYVVFFIGVMLTAPGSAYYHLDPRNATLVWDRLPMTIAFMALVCSQVSDRINARAGLWLLLPAVLLGLGSVWYWRYTEGIGQGNVIPYAILQAYAVVVLLALAWLEPSRYSRGADLFWVFGWYVFSKVLEHFDAEILQALGDTVSGHTLKHVAASLAGFVVVAMLMRRVPAR
jgi:hypothetical protein